jgi:hypothetical protein
MSRRALATAVVAATAIVPLAGLGNAEAATQIKPGFYDCWGYDGTFFTYYGTYLFKTPGLYAYAAERKGNHFVGKVAHGKYKIHGIKLIPTSGPMKRNHLYMQKKNVNEWLLVNKDSLAIACYRYRKH